MPIITPDPVNETTAGNIARASTTVATVAALSAVPVTDLPDGHEAYVQSLDADFQLDSNSTVTADGITVLATPGAGRWLRVFNDSLQWANQLTWYVSDATGNDENSGQSGSPIKTLRELARRLSGVLPTTYTVNILDAVPSTDALDFNPRVIQSGGVFAETSAIVHLVGTPGVALLTGSLATSVGVTPATNTPASMTDGVTASWAPYIGKLVKITSGTHNGYVATILKDEGAGVARLGPWCLPDRALTSPPVLGVGVAPAAASTFEILNLPTLACPVRLGGALRERVTFSFLRETMSFFAVDIALPYHYGVEMAHNAATGVLFFNSLHRYFASSIRPSATSLLVLSGRVIFTGCGLINADLACTNSSRQLIVNCIFQNASIRVGRNPTGASAQDGASIAACVLQGALGAGFFDSTNVEGAISVVNGGDVVVEAPLWGTGNTLGTKLESGGNAFVVSTVTPILTGTTELNFCGSGTALPPLEASAGLVLPAASALTTWAHWAAAPFSRFVMNYGKGSRIISEI